MSSAEAKEYGLIDDVIEQTVKGTEKPTSN
jgi:ATP-dependent protease ClpP protease subunit